MTSCKGRGSCCYFFYFSLLNTFKPTNKSPVNSNECGLTGFLIYFFRWCKRLVGRYFSINTPRTIGKHKKYSFRKETGFISRRWIISAWIFSARTNLALVIEEINTKKFLLGSFIDRSRGSWILQPFHLWRHAEVRQFSSPNLWCSETFELNSQIFNLAFSFSTSQVLRCYLFEHDESVLRLAIPSSTNFMTVWCMNHSPNILNKHQQSKPICWRKSATLSTAPD